MAGWAPNLLPAGERGAAADRPPGQEWRQGWQVVIASALGYGTGNAMVLITAGLFIRPMRLALGLTATQATIAPLMTLIWALASPLSGHLIDRFGPRRAAIVGLGLLALCLGALGLLPPSRAGLYLVAGLIGLISPLTNVPVYASGLSGWFRRNAGAAFGIAFNGSSLVALVATPLASYAIVRFGWQGGYLALAALVLGLGLPAVVGGFRENRTGQRATGIGQRRRLGEVTGTVRCWIYVAAFLIGSIPLGGFMGHLQPMLAERGFPIVTATLLGVAYSVAVCAGRVVGGLLLDRKSPFGVASAMFALAALGGLGLALVQPAIPLALIALTVGLVGLGQGAEADFLAFFALRAFPQGAYATAVGVNVTASCVGMSLGGFGFAALFDHLAGYAAAFAAGAACFLIAGGLLWAARWEERRRARAPAR